MSETHYEIDRIENYYKVSKSNVLIDSVYSLTALEQKVLISVISILNSKEQESFDKYSVSITTLREILGIKRDNFYTYLKEMTLSILSKPFTYYDKEAETTLQATWFSSCKYKDGEGLVEFGFSPEVKGLLLNLKTEYTSYMLGYAVQLKSKYSIRIYELLKKIEGMKTAKFHLTELRNMVGLEKQYPKYAQFKQNVLEVSKKEINKYTDIKFSYKESKLGRKVEYIKFVVQTNVKNIKPSIEKDMFNNTDTTIQLDKYGVSKDMVKKIVETYPNDYIKERIERFEYEMTYNLKKIKEVGQGGYLYKLIKETEWINDKFNTHKKELKEKKKKQKEKEEKQRLKLLKDEYNEYIDTLIKPYSSLEEKDRKRIDVLTDKRMATYLNSKLKEDTIRQIRIDTIEELIREELYNELPTFIEWELQR